MDHVVGGEKVAPANAWGQVFDLRDGVPQGSRIIVVVIEPSSPGKSFIGDRRLLCPDEDRVW